jgi:transposase
MDTGGARVLKANRAQIGFELVDLDQLLPMDHEARLCVAFVESLDLTELYAAVGAREGEAGRPPADPALLLALWLYATIDDVGSAREVARLADLNIAYRWIMGGVSVNYHGLSDFRVAHGDLLDKLLTESVTVLMEQGLTTLDQVVADGTKVKASAGQGSFGGKDRMARIETFAKQRVERLREEAEAEPGASAKRTQAAKLRAAKELAERAAKAAKKLAELREEKEERAKTHAKEEEEKAEPKASSTDPDARRMRFPDGGVKPGYNMQIACSKEGFVVGLEATDRRNDTGLAKPMMEQIANRYGQLPKKLLVDTKYAAADDIVALAEHRLGPVMVYAPVPEEKQDVKPDTLRRRLAERAKEHKALKEWRARMDTGAGQDIHRKRRRIELVNAHFKNNGFGQMLLRGLEKVRIVGLLHALAHNLMLANYYRRQKA